MTVSKDKDREPAIPGYIQGSLINILQFDKDMLSEYGLKIAEIFNQMIEEDNLKNKQSAKELDDLFEDE